jgi:cytochrome c6
MLAQTVALASPVAAADEAAQLALGQKLFTRAAVPSCGLCHTLKHAGSEGAVGPVLDELKPDSARVATALRNGLGQMPSYKSTLSSAEIEALALYVAKASAAASAVPK